MQYKQISGVAIKAAESGTAEVVIATLGVVDSDGDIVTPGAIGSQTVPILPAHNWSSVPLGKARTREVGNHVIADMQFNLAIPEARSWHEAIRFDVEHGPPVQEYSWGYAATKSRPSQVDGRRVRLLERVRLDEVSMVVRGASVGSGTLAVKCTDCAARGPHGGHGVDSETARVFAEAKRHVDAYNARERDAYEYLRTVADGLLHAELDDIREQFELEWAFDEARKHLSHYYTETEHPDPVIARAGQACLEMCAAELGIDPPPLRWMVPETPQERVHAITYGARDWPYLRSDVPIYAAYQVATGIVWVRADLSFDRTMEYVAHEVRHAAGGDEEAAYAYQRTWADRLPRHYPT